MQGMNNYKLNLFLFEELRGCIFEIVLEGSRSYNLDLQILWNFCQESGLRVERCKLRCIKFSSHISNHNCQCLSLIYRCWKQDSFISTTKIKPLPVAPIPKTKFSKLIDKSKGYISKSFRLPKLNNFLGLLYKDSILIRRNLG